jgi:hypothetical protein
VVTFSPSKRERWVRFPPATFLFALLGEADLTPCSDLFLVEVGISYTEASEASAGYHRLEDLYV